MTIYAAGGESEIFGVATAWRGTPYHDSNYSRIAARPHNFGSGTLSLGHSFGGDSEAGAWVHFRCTTSSYRSYDAHERLLRLFSPTRTIAHIDLHDSIINNIEVWSSTGVHASEDPEASNVGTYFYDLHYYRNSSGGTTLDVYRDSVLLVTLSASGTNDYLSSLSFYQASSEEDDGQNAFSEVIVGDEDTRGMRVKTIVATGDDPTHDWTGTYAEIDEYDDSGDGISAASDGQTALFTHTNDIALNNIHSFVIAGRIAAAAPDGAQALVRIGGVNYETPFTTDLTAGERPCFAVFPSNPATGLPWTASDLNSMSFGIKSGPPA